MVVVGNDFDFSYERLTAAARAVAAGAPFLTPNLDPRLPVENGDFLPGCGAIVEAVAAAAGVRPIVVGKPEPRCSSWRWRGWASTAERRRWWATAWTRTSAARGAWA